MTFQNLFLTAELRNCLDKLFNVYRYGISAMHVFHILIHIPCEVIGNVIDYYGQITFDNF